MTVLLFGALSQIVVGCSSSPQVSWDQGSQAMLGQAQIQLQAQLWQNQMGGDASQASMLHGALYFNSDDDLPAGLEVIQVALKQGEWQHLLTPEAVELRVHDEQHWEVAFAVDAMPPKAQPVNVKVGLRYEGKVMYLVDRDVVIDLVY
ncbi:hypothetical protein HGP28_05100 [Vibrio sp. SM6]|uniref:DNA polymerase III subunit beta n=1 Tax=Vibrio agarilyticus TaxID=2726741 RepID=A0A7X8TP19_9VIBR|nr:hypothetical protein [Vibrio agarilyticus]NLS12273.1 hypothetical protein [Vibrio agarilyticus]